MTLARFRAKNHPQQIRLRGAVSSIDDRRTDPELFAALDARFSFTIDVAAALHNALLPRYFTPEDDGLAQSWSGERVWCNPPYSNIEPWVLKAHAERDACLVVMLLPANRTEQGWWQDHVEPYRDRCGSRLKVEFLRGRIRFIHPEADAIGPNERPPFGCCLLIWGAVA